ncbi:MAG: quinone oxidoreductase [Rhodospirillales bacterium]|nr:quinone oxidoreductase [Alphaproteobacteria bacterium]MBL6947362.1 quinone oxidoreductase [Rhodospirillales bacterium]
MKTKVMQIHQHGGPEVLSWDDVELSDPGPGEALIRHTAIGFNFVDTYHRSGQLGHKVTFPLILGSQGAGVVEATGDGVENLKVGDRVTYANLLGSYTEARIIPANRMVITPDDISDELAAAAFLRSLTARYLLKRLYPVQPGETILVHAAAGGTGLILCQWAKALGAVVIGTVSNDAKAEIARGAGCAHPIVYTRENFVDEVMEITNGKGVPVVYDSVGRDTFMGSLDCLQPMGLGINFGTASGQVEPFPMQHLHKKSLIVTRPTLATYIAKREDLDTASEEVFRVLRDGTVKVGITREFALKDAADAHRAIESRETTGAMILVP